MIRFTNKKGESQTITEICDTCKRHIKNLSVNDILVKPDSLDGVTVRDSDGNEVTRKGPRDKVYCEDCS
tara:strand:+ start:138 stop:344 length:207 start_codon:yes stop_codon:yes gene_type:complete